MVTLCGTVFIATMPLLMLLLAEHWSVGTYAVGAALLCLPGAVVFVTVLLRWKDRLRPGARPMPAVALERAPFPGRPPGYAELASRLHDTVGQGLTAIAMQAGGADENDHRLRVIGETAAHTMVELRRAMGHLRGEEHRLGSADECLVDVVNHLRRTGLAVVFRSRGTDEHLPAPLRAVVIRVARESLTNALKYAPGSTVLVEFRVDRWVRLRVWSHHRPPLPLGRAHHVGTPAPDPTPWSGGQGSRSMQRLVAEHGGCLTTGAGEGGFTVLVHLPLSRSAGAPVASTTG
ncbi:sensor histidine kinase [Streptomyces gilvus]|uniref:sensor histidine kinase n=1 Tax=Streptomyces gilvus TaxID=2920937 RepID=UPI001F0E37D4|nr:histidine kinase [Streptomyces sp. CME 23]MCH5670873.1 histidine kinase [Streptomyces sp. CME 23]